MPQPQQLNCNNKQNKNTIIKLILNIGINAFQFEQYFILGECEIAMIRFS